MLTTIYCRELGLLVCRMCFVRQSYAQSTRKKLPIILLHENWHTSSFTLQFPMIYCKLVRYGNDHLYAFAYNYTFPVHPHISKWVLSGAGMHLHQCFPAAPQGIELRRIYAHSYLLSILSAIVYDYLRLFRTLNLFAISIVYAVPRLSVTICYLSAILCYYRVLPTTIL